MTPARRAGQRDAGGVGKWPVALIDRRAVLGRHVEGVDDVLDPDRNALEQARPPGAVDRARLGQCPLGVEPDPGLDRGARLGAVEAVAGQALGGQATGFEARGGLAGGQPLGAAHGCSPRRSRLSTHKPASSSRASSWRRPTSWMPTGNPSGPCPAGKVRHGIANCVHNALKTAEPVPARVRGAWPGAGKVKIASKPRGPFARRDARLFGRAAGVAELIEGDLAAEGDLFLAQRCAEQRFMAVELGHVVAQPLEPAEGLLDLVGCGAFGRERGVGDFRAGGGEPIGGGFEHGATFRFGVVPMRAAAQAKAWRCLRH